MKLAAWLGVSLLEFSAIALLAQAGDLRHEDVVKGMLTALGDIHQVLVGIKDEPTAAAGKPELKKHGDRMADLRKKAAELPQPTKEEKDRLERAYRDKL